MENALKVSEPSYPKPYISMNQSENTERAERDERYRVSQDDVSIIRKEVNKLTQVVGDLTQAIKGNDIGNKGLVARIEDVEEMQDSLNKKLESIIANAKSRETYVRIIWGLICFVVGTIFVAIIDRFMPPKGK